jgi:excisionase family DNA binding protein
VSTVEPTRLLTAREVAARLGVSLPTVRRRIRSGELPAVRLGNQPGTAVRVDERELDAFVYGVPPAHAGEHGPEAAMRTITSVSLTVLPLLWDSCESPRTLVCPLVDVRCRDLD